MASIKYYAESEIDSHYQVLLNELIEILQTNDMHTLISRIACLQASEIHDISLYSTDYTEELKGYTSSSLALRKFFSFLRWYDHSVIRELVTSCGCHDGIHLLDQYISQIDLLQEISNYNTPHIFSFSEIPKAHTLMAIKYKKQFCSLSLHVIYGIKCELLKLCDLTKYAFTLMGVVDYSSDVFYGFVPNAVIPLISRKVRLESSCLHKMGILEVAAYPDFSFQTGYIRETSSRNHFAFIDTVSERISFTSITSMENKIAKVIKQRNHYYTENQRLKKETDDMYTKLIQLKLKNNPSKDDQLKEKQEKLENWIKYAEEIQDKLEETELQRDKEQTKLKESEEHVKELETKLQDLLNASASNTASLSQIQSELSVKTLELAQLKESMQKLITTHMKLKKQYSDKEKHTKELQQELEMIQQQLSAKQAEIKASQEVLKKLTATKQNMEVDAAIRNEELSQTQSILSIKTQQLGELKTSHQNLNDKHAMLKVQQKKETEELQEEISNKKSELAQKEECIKEIHEYNKKLREINFQQSLARIQVIRRCVIHLKKQFKVDDTEEPSDTEEKIKQDDISSSSHEDQQSVLIEQFQQLQIEMYELNLHMGKAENSNEQKGILCNFELESLQHFELSLAQLIDYFTDESKKLLYDSLQSQEKLYQAQASIAELETELKKAEKDEGRYRDTISQMLTDAGTLTEKELENTIQTLVDYLLEIQFNCQEKINKLFEKSTNNSLEESEQDGTGISIKALIDQTRGALCEFMELTKEDAQDKRKKMEELLSSLQDHKLEMVKCIAILAKELENHKMNSSFVQRQKACVIAASQLQGLQINLEDIQFGATCRLGITISSLINGKCCLLSQLQVKNTPQLIQIFFTEVDCSMNKSPKALKFSEEHTAAKTQKRGGLIENTVFKQFFSQLVTMLPITNITHLLVSAQIITTDDTEAIKGMSTSKEKSSFVLNIVAKSLEVGIFNSFYALLDIMENYGGDVTTLTNNIRSALSESSDL